MSVRVMPVSVTLHVGDSVNFVALESQSGSITWSVSPSGVVALNHTSGPSVNVKAVASGSAILTATDSQGEKATASITVV